MKILALTNDHNLVNGLEVPGYSLDCIYVQDESHLWDLIEMMTSGPVALVLVDDDLIRPNSARVIQMARKMRKDIPVIFLTSDKSIELGKMISQLGIDFYGHKPLNKEDLSQVLVSILKARYKSVN